MSSIPDKMDSVNTSGNQGRLLTRKSLGKSLKDSSEDCATVLQIKLIEKIVEIQKVYNGY